MAIDNEELMRKFVRTGMIMRHIDGEGPRCHKHGGHHGKKHGHGHGEARFDFRAEDEMPSGPHGRPPHGDPDFGTEGHGHGHGKGRCKHSGQRRNGQMRAITMVAMKEGISQKDLAFLLGIRPQTLGEMLQKLEGYGLVERRKSETDGRVIEVYLTDAGRTHAAEYAEIRKRMASDLFSVLTEEEKEQLAAILDKLGAEVDKYRPKGHGHGHGHGDEAGADAAPGDEFNEPAHLA